MKMLPNHTFFPYFNNTNCTQTLDSQILTFSHPFWFLEKIWNQSCPFHFFLFPIPTKISTLLNGPIRWRDNSCRALPLARTKSPISPLFLGLEKSWKNTFESKINVQSEYSIHFSLFELLHLRITGKQCHLFCSTNIPLLAPVANEPKNFS